MARSGFVVATGVVVAAFAAGLLIGKSTMLAPAAPGEGVSGSLATVEGVSSSGAGERRNFEQVRDADAPRPAAEEIEGFAFSRLRLDLSGDVPAACFDFTERLDDSGKTQYGDYVKFKPSIKAAASVSDKSLCFTGFDYDKDYTAELRAGLPSASNEALGADEEVTISFGDRPAFAGFVGEGVILPRMEADGVGLETVNVDKLKVTVRRVGDRILNTKTINAGENVMEDRYGYVYSGEDGSDVGVIVWEGEIDVANIVNEPVTTVFPLGAALGSLREKDPGNPGLRAGAYFIEIEDVSEGAPEYRAARAWRWIVFTDMALTTYSGVDGIDVMVRSLETARPMSDVSLQLIAQNNDVLMRGKSDGDGLVRFRGPMTQGEGASRPSMIMAYGPKGDFSVIDLNRSSLDLSDRDVDGRRANPVVDSYIWFDRGIYRPGETVHISAMLRDRNANAVEGRGASITILRPNRTEAAVTRIKDMAAGGFTWAYDIPASSPRGGWTVKLEIDGVDEPAYESFSVEDFVPQRIAVEVDADEDVPILAGQERAVEIDVRYLYGAPGSGLKVEGEARLRVDPSPFDDYPGYSFGLAEKTFNQQFIQLGETQTDGDGKASLLLGVDKNVDTTGRPLRAEVVIGVAEPGGRYVNESARVPVRVDDYYLGIKRSDENTGRNKPNSFEIVLLDAKGQEVEGNALEWRLLEEDYRYEWYRANGDWRWRRDYRDIPVATGKVTSRRSGPVKITRTLDYGSYRLEVSDRKTGTKSSHRFYVGWRSYASGSQSPDQATLTGPDKPVTPGSQVKVMLDAPYAGEAVIVIATDKVQWVERYRLTGKSREIAIPTKAEWGNGFYVLATVVTPRHAVDQPVPRRAMGVAYVPFDMSKRTLEVSLDLPEMIRPRQKLDLPVKIDGVPSGGEVFMTIAAVDEGILRLTKFKSPSPTDWYFGKKALAVRLHDDYGRLLNPNLGAPTRFGGDSLGGEGLSVVPVKSIALFSGLVEIGDNGRAQVPIDIPDFNGELRVMAVAWSASKIGNSDQPLTVRDKVPALLSLPRFLAPGDEAAATLLIDNVEGAGGSYIASVSGEGPVVMEESLTIPLRRGEKRTETFSLKAETPGIADISLAVEGPGDFAVSRSYPIEIRTAHFPTTEIQTRLQKSGERYTPMPDILDGYIPSTTKVKLSWSPLKGVDPQSLLDSLRRYPYGCTEQLTSSAWPLLYVDKLGGLVDADAERELRPRVQEAINKILDRQSPDGAFGLWRAGDRYATGWIGVYVTDFLYRAKEAGYAVPDEAMDRAYEALQNLTKPTGYIGVSYQLRVAHGSVWADKTEDLRRRTSAYAFYVLARQGRADMSDLRYFHDNHRDKIKSPLARMHLAAALAQMGDRARARDSFKAVEKTVGYDNTGNYYQSPLRDSAAMLAIAADLGNDDLIEKFAEDMDKRMKKESRLNTQEKAFILLAAARMIERAGPVTIKMGEEVLSGKLPSIMLSIDELGQSSFVNAGDGGVFRTLSIFGVTKLAPPAEEKGFWLDKTIYTMEGDQALLSEVSQNDRFIIRLKGQPGDFRDHPVMLVDLLPAGFEIESIIRPEDAGDNGPYSWLGDISRGKVAEARDDRFVAAIDVMRYRGDELSGRFTFAYIVRAVTPGKFTVPGAVVEDMYRPGVYARTETSALVINEAP